MPTHRAAVCIGLSCLLCGITHAGETLPSPRIINIINFIRGVEPRSEVDLLRPVVEQIKLARRHGLPTTFLIQYNNGLGTSAQGVVTLEPVCTGGGGGGDPEWVRWFLDMTATSPCLAFAYTQVGQENSFGWPAMEKGLSDQVHQLAELSRAGTVRVETLEASGRWFRKTFPQTPASAVVALSDWKNAGRRSVWYDSRFYRTNLFWEKDEFRIRDIHLFNERYAERYLKERVTTHACTYDTLPVMDGFNWSTKDFLTGMRPVLIADDRKTSPLQVDEPTITASGADTLVVAMAMKSGGRLDIRCEPAKLRVAVAGDQAPKAWALQFTWAAGKQSDVARVTESAIHYRHNSFDYLLRVRSGRCVASGHSGILISPGADGIGFEMDATR